MAFNAAAEDTKYTGIIISQVAGEQPTLAQMKTALLAFNAADNLWYIEDHSTEPVTIKQVNTDIASDIIGADVTPLVRTNNPISATNDVNTNIEKLDAAIGTDAQITPVTRANNPVVVNTSVHQKFDALDAAIGADADLTVVTRAVGQLVANTTLLAKVDALDAVIGFDNQMSGTKKNISSAVTVYQNLDALDVYKTVRTFKKTIGIPGATGVDAVFVTGAGHAAQNLDLGAIIPAMCRVVAIEVVCTASVVGVTDFNIAVGNASAGEQFIAAASCDDLNEVRGIIDATKPAAVAMSTSATNIFFQGDPSDNNWSDISAGGWTIYITVNDLRNI